MSCVIKQLRGRQVQRSGESDLPPVSLLKFVENVVKMIRGKRDGKGRKGGGGEENENGGVVFTSNTHSHVTPVPFSYPPSSFPLIPFLPSLSSLNLPSLHLLPLPSPQFHNLPTYFFPYCWSSVHTAIPKSPPPGRQH